MALIIYLLYARTQRGSLTNSNNQSIIHLRIYRIPNVKQRSRLEDDKKERALAIVAVKQYQGDDDFSLAK